MLRSGANDWIQQCVGFRVGSRPTVTDDYALKYPGNECNGGFFRQLTVVTSAIFQPSLTWGFSRPRRRTAQGRRRL